MYADLVESAVRLRAHHRLLVGFVDVSVVRPRGLGVGVPHHLRCSVVLLKERLCLKLVCILTWLDKVRGRSDGVNEHI